MGPLRFLVTVSILFLFCILLFLSLFLEFLRPLPLHSLDVDVLRRALLLAQNSALIVAEAACSTQDDSIRRVTLTETWLSTDLMAISRF